MKKILGVVWSVLKKTWWIILFVVGIVLGVKLSKPKVQPPADIEKLKKEKEQKQEELENELKKLKKEAEEIEKRDRFTDPNSAADYLSEVLRRVQDSSKK